MAKVQEFISSTVLEGAISEYIQTASNLRKMATLPSRRKNKNEMHRLRLF